MNEEQLKEQVLEIIDSQTANLSLTQYCSLLNDLIDDFNSRLEAIENEL